MTGAAGSTALDWATFGIVTGTLVIAIVALVIAALSLTAAKDALKPLNLSASELKQASNAQQNVVETLTKLLAVERLSRQAASLGELMSHLTMIPRLPQRLVAMPSTEEELDRALDDLLRRDQTALLVYLARLPEFHFENVQRTATAPDFPTALAYVVLAQQEVEAALKAVTDQLRSLSPSPGSP